MVPTASAQSEAAVRCSETRLHLSSSLLVCRRALLLPLPHSGRYNRPLCVLRRRFGGRGRGLSAWRELTALRLRSANPNLNPRATAENACLHRFRGSNTLICARLGAAGAFVPFPVKTARSLFGIACSLVGLLLVTAARGRKKEAAPPPAVAMGGGSRLDGQLARVKAGLASGGSVYEARRPRLALPAGARSAMHRCSSLTSRSSVHRRGESRRSRCSRPSPPGCGLRRTGGTSSGSSQRARAAGCMMHVSL